ncbi:MAG: MBL fold metallo-hydrolase, partial [Clostridia bacterium]|nr:MBL fold metallo-hydrolase [Clostridia bacterium]
IIFADGVQYPARVGCVSLSVGNGEAFCAAGGGKAVIIDISAGNYSPVSAAYEAAASLGATETAALVLTHYHVRHIGTVSRFVSEHKVRSVYLPEPVTSKDASVALSLADAAEIAGVPAFVYSSFEDIDVFGGITLCLSGPLRIDRSTHPVLAFSLRSGSRSIVWFGRSSWESFEIASNLKIDEETTVLAGLHGPVIKSACTFPVSDARRIMLYKPDQIASLTAGAVRPSLLFDLSRTAVEIFPSGIYVEIGP